METTKTPPVVVGFDGSDRGAAALDWAAGYARRHGAPLTVLYASDYPGSSAMMVGRAPAPPAPDLVAKAESLAKEGADRARKDAADLDITARAVFDGPASALVDASQAAQLVVLGDRGRSTVPSLLLGSVARSVATHARCPVAIVREGEQAFPGPEHPVVAGVDDSDAAARAADFAADLAAESDAPLELVHTWEVPTGESWAVGFWGGPAVEQYITSHREAGSALVAALTESIHKRHPALVVTTTVREGRPADALVHASGSAGAVVVGSRGRGGFAGLLLGSTSHQLIHRAECPVVVHRYGQPT